MNVQSRLFFFCAVFAVNAKIQATSNPAAPQPPLPILVDDADNQERKSIRIQRQKKAEREMATAEVLGSTAAMTGVGQQIKQNPLVQVQIDAVPINVEAKNPKAFSADGIFGNDSDPELEG